MEKRFHCGHCGEKISKTLYYQHKKLYYSSSTNTWSSDRYEDDCVPASSFHKDSARDIIDSDADHEQAMATSQEVDEFNFSDSEKETAEGVVEAAVIPEISDADDGKAENNATFELDYNDDDSEESDIFDFEEDDRLIELVSDEEESQPSPHHSSTQNRLIQLYVMFLFMWQTLFRISDTGMNILFLFIAKFYSLIARVGNFIDQLPPNIAAARKSAGINRDDFSRYASCPKCHAVYPLDSCKVVLLDKTVQSRCCSHVKFPNHPYAYRRRPCGTPLMKTVRTSSGTTTLRAKQLYCYRSLIDSLKEFLKRPDFIPKCEAWRKRLRVDGLLSDIYDGRVWSDFMNPGGVPFLSVPYNLALSINVDWFQPFKHSTYATGAIYMAIQNLPRDERYNRENVMLIGVIPGPREPKKEMNSYLRPLVKELNQLWDGVMMQCASGTPVIVRAALICTACDIPAARKVSGFLGHSAYRACSRCLKPFPTKAFGEKADFSGFDRNLWPPRSKDSHFSHAKRYKNARLDREQKAIEREYGCRYSVLLELPYYDIVRFCVIDPMHNLLLGTAKHVLTVWKSTGIIGDSHFDGIQRKVDAFITPTDIGRIPGKIVSGFSSFTAEQWRNWTLIYSLCSLKEILPYRHYDCWLLFVKSIHC